MAYQINKTDGTIVTNVADGQVDQDSTDLTLIGKNFSGFGEALNENFIKLLENFADTSRPINPLRGQIWFDTSELKLKVYSGTEFVPVSSATVSNAQPSVLGIGDLWFNNVKKQLFFFDGQNSVLVAPAFSQSQGRSGVQVEDIVDSQNQTRVITLLYTSNVLLGIFSKDRFVPRRQIPGYSENDDGVSFDREILPGFNVGVHKAREIDPDTGIIVDRPLTFRVTAENAEKLGNISAAQYLRKDTANTIDGVLQIRSDLGLIVGSEGLAAISVIGENLVIANSKNERNIRVETKNNDIPELAIQIIASTQTIDFYPGFSNSQINLGGGLTVNGDLTVNGATTTISTATVTVEDKAIELAVPSSGSPSNTIADEGGIILKGDTDKIILWSKDGNPEFSLSGNSSIALKSHAWNFSEHVNLAAGKFFHIDGKQLFRNAGDGKFALTEQVIALDGVTGIGKQVNVTIGPGEIADPVFLKLEDNRISTLQLNQDLEIAPQGNIVLINSPRIIGLTDPTAAQDAATKEYVDRIAETRNIAFSLDLTPDKDNDWIINEVLNNVAPVVEYRNGATARIVCTKFVNQPVEVTPVINTTTAPFVTNNSFDTAQAVVQPVAAENLTIPAQQIIALVREIRVFRISQGVWINIPNEEIVLS